MREKATEHLKKPLRFHAAQALDVKNTLYKINIQYDFVSKSDGCAVSIVLL